ncbi:hypothetical protein [uncultured Maribacter sp.]|uniref:hypothetical protein n=1 Tax=uncultured Maribacter sp. TaxID=431308 RepID=UPI0030EC912E|tara:strand:+ start:8436 stop:8771 length:336 start_codon:yes stop_codon:yes gene_type:complete
MKKPILNYIGWTLIAFLLGFVHMRIVLGPSPEPSSGALKMFNGLHEFVFIYVGSIIGSIIAVIFILLDVFYFKKKLSNNTNATLIRLLLIIFIAIVVGSTHYILEEVVNVI